MPVERSGKSTKFRKYRKSNRSNSNKLIAETTIFSINSDLSDYIALDTNLSNIKINLLLDTEAKISILKIKTIPNNFKINTKDVISIRGITDGKIYTLGSIKIDIKFQNIIFEHKFYIVDDSFDIPTQGILGKDFIKYHGFCIDYNTMTFSAKIDNIQISTAILSEIEPYITYIPSYSEVFRIFHIESNEFPCIIASQNINNDIRIATTIAHKPETWIRIVNTSDKTQKIYTKLNSFEKISDYHIFSMEKEKEKSKENSRDRINQLTNKLKQNIPDHIAEKLIPLCIEFSDIFHLPTDTPTVNNFYTQSLKIKDNESVYVKNYRLPQTQKAEINKQVNQLFKNDLIELSTSSYNSPLILVPKKSETNERKWRMCVDYRLLNKKLISDKFPLARIDEIHDSLGRAKFFSVMDLNAGYHQIPLNEDSRHYTAFSTDTNFYQWKVLPFGINIAPSSFSRMMTLAFSKLNPERVLIYMDDLVVIGNSEKRHLENLKLVFETCRKFNLKLNPDKSKFFKTEVTFLGHKCTRDGLLPDNNKIKAVKNYPIPKDKDEIKRFVAFVNYYRRFVPNFAEYSRPLTYLTKKRVEFKWTDECQTNFEALKNAILQPQILKYPDFNKDFKVIVDASKYACGGVLTQEYNGIDHPINFISKTFKKGEINKSTIEKELIAIHYAITTFRPYLFGRKFTVLSDHKPLIYLYNLKNPASKLTRIRLELEEYDFDVQHIRGKDNVIADALSRISLDSIREMTCENNQVLAITRSMTKRKNESTSNNEQVIEPRVVEELTTTFDKNTPRLRTTNIEINDKKGEVTGIEISAAERHKLIFKIEITKKNNEKVTLKSLLSKIDKKALELNKKKMQWPINDELFKMCTINEFKKACEDYIKFVQISLIPTPEKITSEDQKQKIIEKFHNDPIYGGHYGQKKLYAKIRARYFWKNMVKDIANYVRNCDTCQKTKVLRKTKEPMTITKTPMKPFECVHIDTIGKLPKTINDYEYAVTIICDLTKYLTIIPIQNKSAHEVAKAIVNKFILIYGPMKEIRTDLGTEYHNELLQEICKLLKIEQKFTTAYHHQSVGTIERSHRTLNEYIRAYIQNNIAEWDTYCHYFQFCYNITKHESNGNKYSPFELIYGREAIMPFDILNGQIDPIYNTDNYAKELKYRLQKSHKQTVEIIKKMKERNKQYYDSSINTVDIKKGDRVFLNVEPYNKHKYIRNGPFIVLDIDEPNVTIDLNNKKYTVHKNRLTLTNNS